MDLLIALCLIIELAIIVTTAVKLIVADPVARLRYLKNFKKGKFAIIYIVAIPLYLVAQLYNGTQPGGALLLAIKAAVELVVLKFDYNTVAALMQSNLLFRVTIDICFIAVIMNAMMFSFAVLGESAVNYLRRTLTQHFARKTYVIVGFNEQNTQIVKSVNRREGRVIMLTDNAAAADFCHVTRCCHAKVIGGGLDETLEQLFPVFARRTVNVLINTGDDALNLLYTEQLSKLITKTAESQSALDDEGLFGFVFGEPENSSAFLHFVAKTEGCIHYVNKYKLIAIDFIDKYPITQYMTAAHIDYATATVRPEVQPNVLLIGFGKTNQQIFLTSVANNQLMTKENGELRDLPISYWIYDTKDARNDKNLNHNYYRYTKEFDATGGEYLPLAPIPAREAFFELSTNDVGFYKSLREHMTAADGKIAVNSVIIAFGTDMQNLDFAEKLSAKVKEWGLKDQTKIFVKIRDGELCRRVVDIEYASESGFVTFGNENQVVYSLSQIVDEKHEMMARDRHLCYALSDHATDDIAAGITTEEHAMLVKRAATQKWYSMAQAQRESNIYAVLSIRMKLQLAGFDYTSRENSVDVSKVFYDKYTQGDAIVYDDLREAVEGRKNIVYTNNMTIDSMRYTYAVQEHQRWNAYMISCGFVPSTIPQIVAGDSKNMLLRRHGNLTTFEGLVRFRQLVAEATGRTEEETDVIRYDYQLMDDVCWMLDRAKQAIVYSDQT